MSGKRTYGTGSVRLITGSTWEMKYRPKWANKPLYKRVEAPNPKKAEDLLTDWRRELDGFNKAPVELSIDQLHDIFVSDMRRRKRSSADHCSMRFKKNLGKYFKGRDLVALETRDVRKYVDFRMAEGAADATINRELSALLRALRLAKDEGSARNVPAFPKLEENNTRIGFVEREQYLTMLRLLPRRSQMFWCLGYHWGIRKGELLKLKWSWLLPYWMEDEPIVKVPGFEKKQRITKNGKPHTLPLYEEEMRVFVRMAMSERNQQCDALFQDNDKPLTLHKVREDFEKARKDARLPEMIFHDLRRTAIRLMENASIPRAEAMQISGHSTESIYKRYDIASEKGAKTTGKALREFYARERAAEQELVGKLVGEDSEDARKGDVESTRKLLN